ncbi:hypothetical protein Agub_g6513 [Astrephomene gubernaculifera]|uniref:DUF1517 domain-containing protein n=1 Tax=Astrephomene gubernaculifera TaxID=47775 RepID=A0AAD3DNZ1_9CHLO|nr:hypothetical protein Agub_g6513 [Astrephomene gubernaculifera]
MHHIGEGHWQARPHVTVNPRQLSAFALGWHQRGLATVVRMTILRRCPQTPIAPDLGTYGHVATSPCAPSRPPPRHMRIRHCALSPGFSCPRFSPLRRPLSSPPAPATPHLPPPRALPELLPAVLPIYPDLAAGIELERLPLWASLLGLLAANAVGLALVLAMLRGLQDASEPLTVVKVQVAMLERRPQLQAKLRELSSMIEVGQQGAWLILEEAILQLLQHQSHIEYASVSQQQLTSKKRAYTVFGQMSAEEAAKANREEAMVRHMGETTDEEGDDFSVGALLGGIMDGLGMRSHPAKEVMVVTLLLATRGRLNIEEKVTDWPQLRHALQQLTGLSSDRIMAIELLWTPRKNTDYLTRQQLERDYPDLVLLGKSGTSSGGGAGGGVGSSGGSDGSGSESDSGQM